MATTTPSEEEGRVLHELLARGDVTAPSRVAELYLPRIVDRMSRRFRDLHDEHLIETAAEDAIISYLERPRQYDPRRLELEHYLWMSAKFDLLNLLVKEERYSQPERIIGLVELEHDIGEYGVEDRSTLTVEERVQILDSPVWTRVREVVPDPLDFSIVVLMMEGERRTEVFSRVMGISALPFDEQAAVVKRNKDRLKKKLQRKLDPKEFRRNG